MGGMGIDGLQGYGVSKAGRCITTASSASGGARASTCRRHSRNEAGGGWLTGPAFAVVPSIAIHVWAYDFVADRTHDGRPLKILTVVDEYSRECLAIVVARRMRSTDVLETRVALFMTDGVPAHIRSACYDQVVKALGAVGLSNRGTDTGTGSLEPAHRASSGLIPEERRVPGGRASSCLRLEGLRTTVGMASSPAGAGASGL